MPELKPCILVVDDNAQTLILVKTVLEKENYRVITADSGEAAPFGGRQFIVTFELQPNGGFSFRKSHDIF